MAFQFTYDLIREITPSGNTTIQKALVDPLNKWMPVYEINTLLRIEHFIAQAAEESAYFRTLTEYASGRAYEFRHDLGNVNAGDGVRYKGRGLLQITGRANYERYGKLLNVDLVNHPELAATADIAVQTAMMYWKDHNLNKYADADDLNTITRRINGGLNGYSARLALLCQTDDAIGDYFPDQDGTKLNP